MFYRLVRHQLPFRSIQTSRSFITSSSVYYNNKKEDEKKQGDSNNKDGGHKQTDHSQDAHSQSDNKPQEEKASQPSVEDQLKECNTEYKALQASYLLSLADQENLRQRATREVANAKDYGIQKFAKDILDSLDILGMALHSVPEEFRSKEGCIHKDSKELAEQLTQLYTGVSLTESVLQKTLKRYDIEVDNPIDQEFDPKKHEAVFQTPIPGKQPGTIFTVQKVGYILKNRVLRPAQVGVVAETKK